MIAMSDDPALPTPRPYESFRVLGTRVDRVQNTDVMAEMERWISEDDGRCRFIVNTGFHGLWEAHRDPAFRAVVEGADMFSPDGIAPVWISRLRRTPLRDRATSAELMDMIFTRSMARGYSHYFFGDTDATLDALREQLAVRYPGMRVAGTFSPPFRALTPEEDQAQVDQINAASPDVLWVGLGLPKQERWIHEHRDRLNARVAIGVGACFGFFSGKVARSPAWVGNVGLEWLWRLSREPRKLWRRAFVDGPQFALHALLELSGLRRY